MIDDQNAIGVMHLGEFPNGMEFATFVMSRHNYPFEKMSVEDHDLIFNDPRTKVPQPAELEGDWNGFLIFVTRPSTTLLNQVNPEAFRLSFRQTPEGKVEGRYRLGLQDGGLDVKLNDEIRMLDDQTLIGKCVPLAFYYILKRV